MCVRGRKSPRTSSSMIARVGSSSSTTWSLSHRTPRLTCRRKPGRELQDGGDFVRQYFHGMEMSGVETDPVFGSSPRSPCKIHASRPRRIPSRCRRVSIPRHPNCAWGSAAWRRSCPATSSRRSRGDLRSAGVSFVPSGIQTFVTQVLPSCLPISAPISRQAIPCSIQKFRMPASALEKREPRHWPKDGKRTWG